MMFAIYNVKVEQANNKGWKNATKVWELSEISKFLDYPRDSWV